MKVVCINDSGRPNEIPLNRWIKKGQVYTIIKADILNADNRRLGVKLEEINNDDLAPYTYFSATRFRPVDGYEGIDAEIYEELYA